MRVPIHVRMGEGDKRRMVEAILWIDEMPPNLRRGRNRKMKNRRWKRQRQEAIQERLRGD